MGRFQALCRGLDYFVFSFVLLAMEHGPSGQLSTELPIGIVVIPMEYRDEHTVRVDNVPCIHIPSNQKVAATTLSTWSVLFYPAWYLV